MLWAGRGALAAWYDPLAIWRDWADDVTGSAIDSGHFMVEERPAETLAALRAFHATGPPAGQGRSLDRCGGRALRETSSPNPASSSTT